MLTQQSRTGILAAALAAISLATSAAGAGTDPVNETPGARMIDLNKRAVAGIQTQHFLAA